MIISNALFLFTFSNLCSAAFSRLQASASILEPNNTSNHSNILPVLRPIHHIETTSLLRIAYFDDGPKTSQTVILMHGFPYDINSFANVVPRLVEEGYRVIAPFLRGYGSTRFLHESTPRSAEQAALGYDLLTFMDALGIEHAVLAGYDWGTIPVNVVAALWPDRCDGMVAVGSYLIQDRSTAWVPSSRDSEASRWYFFLFLTPRGYAALAQQLRAYVKDIWAKNSPQWNFSDAELDRSLPALYNPDFIDITVDFYKGKLLFSSGDPAYTELAIALDKQPSIAVPSVTLDPELSTTFPATNGSATAHFFTGPRVHRVIQGTWENIPQENPQAFTEAIIEVANLKKEKL